MRAFIAQIAVAALTVGVSVPALAQAPSYRAVPVTTMASANRLVVGDTLWMCGTDGCTTTRATARPAIVCEQVARKVGKLTSFATSGATFDDAALAKCNAKAKA